MRARVRRGRKPPTVIILEDGIEFETKVHKFGKRYFVRMPEHWGKGLHGELVKVTVKPKKGWRVVTL